MRKSISVIILAVGLLFAQASPPTGRHVASLRSRQLEKMAAIQADASEFFDQILMGVRSMIESTPALHPFHLPDYTLEFAKEILWICWTGQALLREGSLDGLQTIHRAGVADLTVEDNGDLVITADIAINDGTIGYTGVVKFMDIGPTITVTGTLKSVVARVGIRVNLMDGLQASVDTLDIKNLGILSLHIDGLTAIIDFIAELLLDGIGNLVKGIVGELLEGTIKDLINKAIQDFLENGGTIGRQISHKPAFSVPVFPAHFERISTSSKCDEK